MPPLFNFWFYNGIYLIFTHILGISLARLKADYDI